MNISLKMAIISFAMVLGHCFLPTEAGILDVFIDSAKSIYYNYIAEKAGFPLSTNVLGSLNDIMFHLEVLYDHHRTRQYPECKDYKIIHFYSLLTDSPNIVVTLNKARFNNRGNTVDVRHDFKDGKTIMSVKESSYPRETAFGLPSAWDYHDIRSRSYDRKLGDAIEKEVDDIEYKFKQSAWIGWPKYDATRHPLPRFTDNIKEVLTRIGISYEHYERVRPPRTSSRRQRD